jgi:hypothetical protein
MDWFRYGIISVTDWRNVTDPLSERSLLIMFLFEIIQPWFKKKIVHADRTKKYPQRRHINKSGLWNRTHAFSYLCFITIKHRLINMMWFVWYFFLSCSKRTERNWIKNICIGSYVNYKPNTAPPPPPRNSLCISVDAFKPTPTRSLLFRCNG